MEGCELTALRRPARHHRDRLPHGVPAHHHGVTRIVRDVGIAEELAQDALVAALEQWPRDGVPDNPGAWLMAAARHRAVDLIRRRENYARKLAEIGRDLSDAEPPQEPADPEDIDDDLLRLVFTACHPVLSAEARTALTLRLLGGLTTPEIARAFLVPEATVAQRIVRAKRTLATKNVAFEVPFGPDREARLGSVLDVIYLIYNEGYAATAGDDWLRPGLCEDALRLARVLSGLMPKEPEVHALTALLEFQTSRAAARTGPSGAPVLLRDQNRSRWNRMFIARGITALGRADATATGAPGPYALQAAIAACHAMAYSYEETDWRTISTLYTLLAARAPPRSSNSTARSPCRWRTVPARPWRSSTPSPPNPPCTTTTCCPACAAICCCDWAARRRRGRSSYGRRS